MKWPKHLRLIVGLILFCWPFAAGIYYVAKTIGWPELKHLLLFVAIMASLMVGFCLVCAEDNQKLREKQERRAKEIQP